MTSSPEDMERVSADGRAAGQLSPRFENNLLPLINSFGICMPTVYP